MTPSSGVGTGGAGGVNALSSNNSQVGACTPTYSFDFLSVFICSINR